MKSSPCSHKRHTSRVSHGYRSSHQGLVQARTLARYLRKKGNTCSVDFSNPQTPVLPSTLRKQFYFVSSSGISFP